MACKEVVAISGFYSIFGVTEIAVKLAMLLLFTLGIIFFYKTLTRIAPEQKWLALLVTMAFILSPAWAMWSLKARGGYLTAFFLASVCTYLLLHPKLNLRWLSCFFIGLLLILIYESQPLWLPGLLPLLLYMLIRKGNYKSWLALAAGLVLPGIFFYFLKQNTSDYWSPDVVSFAEINPLLLPEYIYQHLSGSYYLSSLIEPGKVVKVYAAVFTALVFAALAAAVYLFIRKRMQANLLLYVFSFSVAATLGYTLFIQYSPRYLLPLSGFSLFLFFMVLTEIRVKLFGWLVLPFLIVTGAVSVYSFKDFQYQEYQKKEMAALIHYLEEKDTPFVFCEGGLMQWQIMFYSNEKITCRFVAPTDRYSAYVETVNAAFRTDPAKTAVVGYYNSETAARPDVKAIDKSFLIYLNPTLELLQQKGFRFE